MNAVLRHLAIRLWATSLLGSVLCMMVLPFWQSVLKVQWVVVPAILILGLCYLLLGWGMNRYGSARIQRLINEAGAWERAGDRETAQETLEGAVAVFDSFWLSPAGRQKIEPLMTGRLARFYLAQSSTHPRAELIVHQYLMRHPSDVSVVRSWLGQVVGDLHSDARDDLLAARIGDVLSDDLEVQQLLMDYYLGNRRCDFDAVQTYRRVWRLKPGLPDTVVGDLARLLLQNNQLNDWALEVYLKGYESGNPYCLEGVAAACQYLKPHPGNRPELARAQALCESLDADFLKKAANRFKPLTMAATTAPEEPAKPKKTPARRVYGGRLKYIARQGARVVVQLLLWGPRVVSFVARMIRQGRPAQWPARQAKPVLAVTVLLLIVGVTLLAGYGYRHYRTQETTLVLEAPPPEVDLPFTIQVAAYLKPEDAQRYVDHLISQGLEAFSTQAVSARRKWYQVKVSRFETKHQAQLYGEKLKSQGLIDDFYVANYKQQ